MMLPSHLLATLLVGLAVARWRRFTPRDWALALAFGVAIDLDHLVQVPAYVAIHGAAGLQPAQMLTWGSAWQGFLHDPWALLVVGAACVLFRSLVPVAFWGLHMVQDFVIARHFVVWGSPLEWAIVAALLAGVVTLAWAQHRRLAEQPTFARHVMATFGIVR